MSNCPGCFPIFQPNQQGHMGYGGCMEESDFDEQFCTPINLESAFDAAAAETTISVTSNETSSFGTSTETECCICFDTIGEKNNCVTECGHKFCFKCLATAMTRSNSCPCCRAPLIEESAEESDGEYEDGDDDEDDEDEDQDDDEDEPNRDYKGNIEEIVERLEKSGITMLDIASLLFNKFSKTDEKYSNEYVENLCKTIDQINEDAEQESVELEQMGEEDNRLKDHGAYVVYERAVTFEEAMSWGNCVCENECTC
jgi:hypothetical protein